MKQTIVAFGGADMCGKTEISTELARVLRIPRFKASSEHDTYLNHPSSFVSQLRYADSRMVDFLKQTSYSVIFDRAWCCEFAYSQVLQRVTDKRALRRVDDSMAAIGARVIICYRSSYDGITDDVDPKLKNELLAQINQAYRDFGEWTKCKTMFLNVDDENLDREIKDILNWMETT